MENSILNIHNLIGYTLGKWRKIVVASLIFAMILGGYASGLNLTNADSIVVKFEENVNYYEELRVYTKEKSTIDAEIAIIQNEVDAKKEYVNNSLLMGLDGQNLSYGIIDIHIPITEEGTAGDIEKIQNMYINAIPASTMFVNINEKIGYDTKVQYVRELVAYWPDPTTGIITIRFYTNDEKQTAEMGNIILESLQEISAEIKSELPHEFSIVGPIISYYADPTLPKTQQTVLSELDALYADLDVVKQQLDSLVEPSKEYEVEDASTETTSKVNVLLYVIIGTVLGGGLALLAIALVVICSNKIQDGKYISEEHGVYIYGKRPQFPDTKNPIDKIINKISNKTSYNNEDEFYDYIATSINLLNKNKKSIHLIGTIEEKELVLVFKKLEEKIDVFVTCGGNITENSDSLKKLIDANQVILVEKLFNTTDEKLAKEVKLVRELQKEIIGAIIL